MNITGVKNWSLSSVSGVVKENLLSSWPFLSFFSTRQKLSNSSTRRRKAARP